MRLQKLSSAVGVEPEHPGRRAFPNASRSEKLGGLHLKGCARSSREGTCSAFYIFPAPLHVTKDIDQLRHLYLLD